MRVWRAGALLGVAVLARAQTSGTQPLNLPTPLAPAPAAVSPATLSVSLEQAERAHDLGFLSLAESLYRQLLDAPGADRTALTLALTTVLLDAGRAAEAEELLNALPEPRTAAWRLRAGLAAFQLKKRDVAQAQWDAIKAEEVPERDRPWYYFFTGALYDTATREDRRNEQRANEFYLQAERSAATELARARFQLAAERVRLRSQPAPAAEDVSRAREQFNRAQGRELGYEAARQLAVMLALQGKNNEAVDFLQRSVLLGMPAQERNWRDEFNFIIGVLGDKSRNGIGRNALVQLVGSGTKTQRQRQALQILADASQNEPERGHFRGELTRWIAATPPHPLRETLLFFRAQLALTEKDYAAAEDSAQKLLQDYPASPLRSHAYALRTQSAWEQQRYRVAAANAREARKALPVPPAGQPDPMADLRADLGVLEAEAWYRLDEFRFAADAYAEVLRDRPPALLGERGSGLIFQRILAEIRAGSPAAAALIDQFAADPAFRGEHRWEAEWSLARELRLQGKIDEAYARVGRLLGVSASEGPGGAMPAELRARMGWLHAKLAFESERFEQTLAHIDALLRAPGDIDPTLRKEVVSTAVLLRAQAELRLGREPMALGTLKRLRDEFSDTDAAVQSYLVESAYYADQEKIPQAQQRLTALIDHPSYAKNPLRPYALFQLALLSERLGGEKDLEEAHKRIEELVQLDTAAGETDLLFAARLQQGHLLRKMSQFPQAQRAYEYLVNNYAQRPDVVLAELALADSLSGRSAADPTLADQAAAVYERLRDRVDAPPEVRVEAGYKLGFLLERKRQHARAAEVWWKDVIEPFLKNNQQPFTPGDKRPYWLGRTLINVGELYESLARLEEARRAYALILEFKLDHAENTARAGLKRLGVPEANP